jgi:hypothetical protein
MFSADPKRVQAALNTAANLVGGRHPDIFAGAQFGDKLTEAGIAYQHYTVDRGMSPEQATARIMEERTPEYERTVKAKIKSEDVNQIVKKELKPSDITSAFDDSWIPFNDPKLTWDVASRERAMGDYEEIFREKFATSGAGDVALSKKQALKEMRRTWGVTNFDGNKTVMKFAPEGAAAYAGIEDVSEKIAAHAVETIKQWNGVDVDRSKLRIDQAKGTGERYMKGEEPTYLLRYEDKNGVWQTVPGLFYADAGKMRMAQNEARAKAVANIQTRVAIDEDMMDLNRANFGVR